MRYIGNRSSGRMGFAIAAEAARRGAEVTLVAGPTSVEPPAVREVVRVRSAAEMHAAVMARADRARRRRSWRPPSPTTRRRGGRRRRSPKSDDTLTLVLQKTPDILADLGRRRAGVRAAARCSSGFAAETEDVVARATAKRERKHVDLIVANDVSRADAGFDVDTNAVTIVGPDGAETLPLQSKARVAAAILDRVETSARVARRRRGRDQRRPAAAHGDRMDRDQLDEHLRFAAELGVAGVSRDPGLAGAGGRAPRPIATAPAEAAGRRDDSR